MATFDKAAYVRFPDGIVALTGPTVALGPLHLRSSLDQATLSVGETFAVPPAWTKRVQVWRGALPEGHPIDAGILEQVSRKSALLSDPLRLRWAEATTTTDLPQLCRVLGGLGPGLTPSGDDALAGILLAARLRWPEAEAYLVGLATQVDTHEIARAFLIWAARGQSIEPVHRLLHEGTASLGGAEAAAALLAVGHTSGADLALGLHLGLTTFWTSRWAGTRLPPGASASNGAHSHPTAVARSAGGA
jgi:hypothetical protein